MSTNRAKDEVPERKTIEEMNIEELRTHAHYLEDRVALMYGRGTRSSHGHSGSVVKKPSKTYTVWLGMTERCFNKNNTVYRYYGGRGITVCTRWLGSGGFEHFLEDMGLRPEGLSLDRINNNGNYEPDNCRWATKEQQIDNRRPNHNAPKIEAFGLSLTPAEWRDRVHIPSWTIIMRMKRGWDAYKALLTPVASQFDSSKSELRKKGIGCPKNVRA